MSSSNSLERERRKGEIREQQQYQTEEEEARGAE
jgi:hypothetical protein